jgi:hypothetical protein
MKPSPVRLRTELPSLEPDHGRVTINVVGGYGAKCELRDSGGLGPASPEASEMKKPAPLPPIFK